MEQPFVLLSDNQNGYTPSQHLQGTLIQVTNIHRQLRDRLRWQDEGIDGLLNQMMGIKCAVSRKCMMLEIRTLINNNAQVVGGLQSLQRCLGILCKYAQNLLVSPERRPHNWKNVNFSNQTYAQNVSFIKGSEDVLAKLGYTISTPGGMIFPNNQEPDVERIAEVTADLKIVHTELSSYSMGRHPNPESVEEVIPQIWCLPQGRTQQLEGQGQVSDLPEQPSSLLEGQAHVYPHSPGAQSTGLGQLSPQSQGQATGRHGQGYSQVQGQGEGHTLGQAQQYLESQRQMGALVQELQYRLPPPLGENQLRGKGQPKSHVNHMVQGEQEEEEYHDAQENITDPSSEEDCDICGSAKATRWCAECDGKQLCKSCDQTWHRNPRRMKHNRQFLNAHGIWTLRPSTAAKPKGPPDKTMETKNFGNIESQRETQPVISNVPKAPIQTQGIAGEPLPNLSIFNDKRPVPPPNFIGSSVAPTTGYVRPQSSFDDELSSSEYAKGNNSDNQSTKSASFPKAKSLLMEIKGIPNKADQISRIQHELGQLDIRLTQCEEEFNIILRDDEFEDNPEYTRLSRERDHMNRSKILINDYWKQIEQEKHEAKMSKAQNLSPTGENGQQGQNVDIRYPPHELTTRTSAFDFERDIEFPTAQTLQKQAALVKKEESPQNVASQQPVGWICSHCTMQNDMSSKNCRVCTYHSEKPSYVYIDGFTTKQIAWQDQGSASDAEKVVVEHKIPPETAESKIPSEKGEYKSVFVEVQDDIFREKKAARERYEKRMQEKQNTQNNQAEVEEEVVFVKKPPQSGSVYQPLIKGGSELGDQTKLKDTPTGSQSSTYETLFKTRPIPTKQDEPGPEGDYIDMQSKLEGIQRMKEEQEASIQSRELIRWLRKAEKDGYSMKEVEIALEQSEFPDPLYWIDVVWQDKINSLIQRFGEVLSANNPNLVNLIVVSQDDARKALQDADGQIEEAVDSLKTNWEKSMADLFSMGDFPKEKVLQVLEENQADKIATEKALLTEFLKPFEENLWREEEGHLNEILEQKLRITESDEERRIRMVLCEFESKVKSWGRAGMVVRLLEEMPEDVTLEDVIEAVRQCGDREQALSYLQQECVICEGIFPASKILSLTLCQCKVCHECMAGYFDVQIKERHVKNLCCPSCQMPEDVESGEAENHLQFLHNFLQNLVSPEVFEIFEGKIRDWHLMKDPNFRWCSSLNCENGFIFNPEGNRLKMRCDRCLNFTCFRCKKPWLEQHENVSCEQFKAWQEANNPEFQEAGLARHLQENGIDCPKCKMRYSLAKGGCMHFKCTQCGHEFCCGCNHPFLHRGACKALKSCESQGLHCHHPRDCLYYLRDCDIDQLQQLLKDNDVAFRADNPAQADGKCEVLEQKETQAGLRDEPCGKDVEPQQSGLCSIHYKEYLVTEINAHAIDPVTHMRLNDLQTLFNRKEHAVPDRQQQESDTQYKDRLINEVKKNFKLGRRIPVL